MPDGDFDLLADLDLAKDVAREAGALALDWLRRGARSWTKPAGDLVTEADIAVNDLIHGKLRGARPDYGWLSEETRDDPSDRQQSRVWVIDPIDGTKAFMRAEPGFCISIARLEQKKPVIGVLFNPLTDELLAAAAGHGATLNGRRILTLSTAGLEGCGIIIRPEINARLRKHPAWPDARILHPMPSSIAYRIGLVASGRWDAAIVLARTNDWDIAAAALILSEAGGIATDGEGEGLVFNRAVTTHPGVVAAGASVHPLLMDRLREMGRPS